MVRVGVNDPHSYCKKTTLIEVESQIDELHVFQARDEETSLPVSERDNQVNKVAWTVLLYMVIICRMSIIMTGYCYSKHFVGHSLTMNQL